MPAKRKKVVVNPNTLQTQDLGKQPAQQLLSRIARKSQNTSTNLRRRQRTAVQLPVRRQRQTIQNNNRRRHHVVGQARPNMRTQRRRIRLRPSRQNNIPNELRNPRPIRTRTHTPLRHTRVPNHRALELPTPNPQPPSLHPTPPPPPNPPTPTHTP